MSFSSGNIRCLPFVLWLSLFTKADCLPELGRFPNSKASLWGFLFSSFHVCGVLPGSQCWVSAGPVSVQFENVLWGRSHTRLRMHQPPIPKGRWYAAQVNRTEQGCLAWFGCFAWLPDCHKSGMMPYDGRRPLTFYLISPRVPEKAGTSILVMRKAG